MNSVTVVAITALLTACAGRQAIPMAAVQPGDDALTCPQILNALIINTGTVRGLLAERQRDIGGNVAAAVVGVLFLPALFFLDMKGAASDEARGAVRRNETLAKRYELLKCTPLLSERPAGDVILNWDEATKTPSPAAVSAPAK